MKLQDFVKQSLIEISTGVKLAHSADTAIAPLLKMQDIKGSPVDQHGMPTFMVEFDVAVTTSRESEMSGEAKGGLISVISGGIDTSMSTKSEFVNRLKFNVPISYYEQQLG
jgi:hypothetical protein